MFYVAEGNRGAEQQTSLSIPHGTECFRTKKEALENVGYIKNRTNHLFVVEEEDVESFGEEGNPQVYVLRRTVPKVSWVRTTGLLARHCKAELVSIWKLPLALRQKVLISIGKAEGLLGRLTELPLVVLKRDQQLIARHIGNSGYPLPPSEKIFDVLHLYVEHSANNDIFTQVEDLLFRTKYYLGSENNTAKEMLPEFADALEGKDVFDIQIDVIAKKILLSVYYVIDPNHPMLAYNAF